MGAYPPGYAQLPVPVPKTGGDKTRTFIVVAVIIALVVVAGAAGFYFLVIKNSGAATGPEQAVLNYFKALQSGDTAAIKSLYAPGAQPDDLALQLATTMYSSGILKLSDFKLKTLNQTATDATVQVEDATVSVGIAGQSIKQPLSSFNGNRVMAFKLRDVNGKWFIVSDASMNLVPSIPGAPTAPSNPI